jgi:hypothetical protein
VREGKLHVILKTMLWQVLEMAYRGQHGIGCDQLPFAGTRQSPAMPRTRCLHQAARRRVSI